MEGRKRHCENARLCFIADVSCRVAAQFFGFPASRFSVPSLFGERFCFNHSIFVVTVLSMSRWPLTNGTAGADPSIPMVVIKQTNLSLGITWLSFLYHLPFGLVSPVFELLRLLLVLWHA